MEVWANYHMCMYFYEERFIKFKEIYELKNAKMVKNLGDPSLIPGSGRFPWRREWLHTPVFLPGKLQGQRSLAGVHRVAKSWTQLSN